MINNRVIVTGVLILGVGFISSCQNPTNKTLNNEAVSNSSDKMQNDAITISEENIIDEEYLKNRYPDKTVLTWVYPELNNMTDEDRITYNMPLGMRYVTNNQIIRLNDYLESKGKEYVICFKKLRGGDSFSEDIINLVSEGNAPDLIFSEWYSDEVETPSYSVLTYDLLNKKLLENLLPYKEYELKEYYETLPENAIELSEVNGAFYGYNLGIGSQKHSRYWFINTDLANEYNIELEENIDCTFSKWSNACDIVYKGEKEKKTSNFKIYEYGFIENKNINNIAGYIGKISRTSCIDVTSIGIQVKNEKAENYYKSNGIKEQYKELFNCKKKGYFDYLNENVNDNTRDANLFISNIYPRLAEKSEIRGEIVDNMVSFPKAINFKEYLSDGIAVNKGELWSSFAVNGVCSKSDELKISLEAYNFINSDIEASNIIKYPEYDFSGEEYTITESEYYSFYDRSENYGKFERRSYKLVNPFVANPFAEYYSIDEYKENVSKLKYNKHIGELYDLASVESELEQIEDVEIKYIGHNCDGKLFLTDDFDNTWNEFIEMLEKAGIDQVVKVINAQICDE